MTGFMTFSKKTSIILPSYVIDEEVYGYLKRCLEAIKAHTTDYELIIIDNGSKFGKEEMKAAADKYIERDYPMGYARAVNLGLALAEGEYLCIINNDLFAPDKWLDILIRDYGQTKGGIMSPMDRKSNVGIVYDEHWFSCILMNRETFTKVGYLDELINYRFHDQDYSIRVKKAGLEVMRTGNVVVEHINSATYSKMGRNEDPEEEKIMIERHGYAHFNDWIKKN